MRTVSCLLVVAAAQAAPGADVAPRSRAFLFTYATTIGDLPRGARVRVWLPVAPSNDEQWVRVEKMPAGAKVHYDEASDNHYLYFEPKPGADGKVSLEVVYRVKRYELRGFTETLTAGAERVQRFLEPSALVPTDGKPLKLLDGKSLPDDPTWRPRRGSACPTQHSVPRPAPRPPATMWTGPVQLGHGEGAFRAALGLTPAA